MYSHKKKSVFYSAKNLLFSHWISKQNLSFRLHYMYSQKKNLSYSTKKIYFFYSTKNLVSYFIIIFKAIFTTNLYKYKFVILSLTCWFDLQWTTATDKVDSQVQIIIMLRSAASSKLILFPFFGNQIFLLKML